MSTLVLSTDHALLKKFWDVMDGVPPDNREQFSHAFISALSGNVSDAQWIDALRIARGFVSQNLKAKNAVANAEEKPPNESTAS